MELWKVYAENAEDTTFLPGVLEWKGRGSPTWSVKQVLIDHTHLFTTAGGARAVAGRTMPEIEEGQKGALRALRTNCSSLKHFLQAQWSVHLVRMVTTWTGERAIRSEMQN